MNVLREWAKAACIGFPVALVSIPQAHAEDAPTTDLAQLAHVLEQAISAKDNTTYALQRIANDPYIQELSGQCNEEQIMAARIMRTLVPLLAELHQSPETFESDSSIKNGSLGDDFQFDAQLAIYCTGHALDIYTDYKNIIITIMVKNAIRNLFEDAGNSVAKAYDGYTEFSTPLSLDTALIRIKAEQTFEENRAEYESLLIELQTAMDVLDPLLGWMENNAQTAPKSTPDIPHPGMPN